MNEKAAGEVLLVRAFETTDGTPWTAADRAWASRVAAEALGEDAPADAFVAYRAHAALQRLAPLQPALAHWRALALWRAEWLWLVLLAGLVLGALANQFGGSQRINLLAPPVWLVIAWNLLVYLGLLWHRLAHTDHAGAVRLALSAHWRRWQLRRLTRLRSEPHGPGSATAWVTFGEDWARHSQPLLFARLALALHLGAAALALGLIAGLYLRGLVLDYRVAWQSTFLHADMVHALLTTLLAPATAATGIDVPDAAAIQALRLPGGSSAPAAPWIHLYAMQLLLLVVVPRLLLAAWTARRGIALSRNFPLPLDAPYFQRLRPPPRGGVRRFLLWPYACAPDATALHNVQALLTQTWGEGSEVDLQPSVPYGGEDDWQPPSAQGETAVALFDLSATPEAENQGRFLQRLAEAAPGPVVMLVDEANFATRFSAERLQQRRQAWQALAQQNRLTVLFVNLQAPDPGALRETLARHGEAAA